MFLREELLEGAAASHHGGRQLAPPAFFVLTALEDHADNPSNAHAVYVGQFLDMVVNWFRDVRKGRSSPSPSEPELAGVFGDDWKIVQLIWPALAALSDEQVNKRDKGIGAKLAIFVLQANQLVGSSAVAQMVRAHLAGRRPEDVDDVVANVHAWLQSKSDRFAGMLAERGVASVVSYVRRSITSFASDSLRVPVPAFDPRTGAWLPDGERQVSARTRRRHRKQGATSPAEFAQSLAAAGKRQSHHGSNGKTLAELEATLDWPARTISKALAAVEWAIRQKAPRSGRYARLTPYWVELVRAELLKKQPRHERRRDEPDT